VITSVSVVTGMDHFGATVSDMERSLAFWKDLLGLEEVGRGVIEWEHIDRLVALDDTKLEWVELRVPGGGRVELMEYHRPVSEAAVPMGEENEPGRSHLSLLVDDLDALMAELGAAGVRSRTPEPVDMVVGAYAGGKGAYVFDPDGVQIELIQRARPATAGGTYEGKG
jgi:catechol 2,3-dioxygenase-like lactoylglutathione lyase family enzyme